MKFTLCGSTRFKRHFQWLDNRLTKQGNVVYTVNAFGHADGLKHTRKEKARLDAVHMAKILNSDAIYVIDVEGYIGESTEREIEFARVLGKQVWFLSRELNRSSKEDANLEDEPAELTERNGG